MSGLLPQQKDDEKGEDDEEWDGGDNDPDPVVGEVQAAQPPVLPEHAGEDGLLGGLEDSVPEAGLLQPQQRSAVLL